MEISDTTVLLCKGAIYHIVKMSNYTEQKKKRNNRPPRIFGFKGKTLIISGLLLYDYHSWDIRVSCKKLIFISIKIE